MLINNLNSTSFSGGFRFKQMPIEAKYELPNVIKKGRQIFYDFENKGDVFMLTRGEKDYAVIKFIRKNKLESVYYPELNTKMGMDDEKPEELSKLIESLKPQAITTLAQMNKTRPLSPDSININEKNDLLKILKNFNMDLNDYKLAENKGTLTLLSIDDSKKIRISPKSINGFRYVMIEPKSLEENVLRYAIDPSGEIIAEYRTPDEIRQFKTNFSNTIK